MSAVPLLKPPAVANGAGISVVAPASFAEPARVERGLQSLRQLGFAPQLSAAAQARGPLYFAGTPAERLADLHSAFADESTSAIFSLRGGYGSNYLLDQLDLKLIAAHPKPLFAYSDLTGVQLHLLDTIGLPVFHGPMVAADFYLDDGVHLPSFQAAIGGTPYSVGAAEGLRTLKAGTAEGTLYGGCLSIFAAMLGTDYEPQTEGKLLFLEDTGVKPYQIDRMLWQLRAAGKLDGVTGIIFGEMLNCVSPGAQPELLEEAILSALEGFEGPIAIGLRSGHVSQQNVTLTFGVRASLNATAEPTLEMREAAVTR